MDRRYMMHIMYIMYIRYMSTKHGIVVACAGQHGPSRVCGSRFSRGQMMVVSMVFNPCKKTVQ